MSEKRFGVYEHKDFYDNKDVTDNGGRLDEYECADLLNRQAAQLEVLREWVRKTPDTVNRLMLDAHDLLGINPEGKEEADKVLTALGIEERLT